MSKTHSGIFGALMALLTLCLNQSLILRIRILSEKSFLSIVVEERDLKTDTIALILKEKSDDSAPYFLIA